ncbi:membrane protein [Enterobacter ludwigii]|nr:membrane protein [Enterobacter ludwigii]
MGLGVSGIAFTIWFFFLSSSESRYIWGMFSIAEFFAGYLIYRFAYTYVYDE